MQRQEITRKGPTMTQPSPADQALARLQEGNRNIARGRPENPRLELDHLLAVAREGQEPFATVVGCSDSRCPVELLFDAGLGDIFVIRVAGNICSGDEIASVEFGVVYVKTPLVVVLGHRHCGAVTAAVEGEEATGQIPELLMEIEPAVRKAHGEHPEASPAELIDHAVRNNVWQAIENLFQGSSIIAAHVRDGKIKVVGAYLDIETARVDWMGEHPQQAGLMMH